MPLQIVSIDITKIACDVIVNPTDEYYSGSGGADLAIHRAAGEGLKNACQSLLSLPVGEIAVTEGFKLPAKYIIHTRGPIWQGGEYGEADDLQSCYLSALVKSRELGAKSIAFPLISSGTYGFPRDRVLRIATQTIAEFLRESDDDPEIYLCIHNRNAYEAPMEHELDGFLNRLEMPMMAMSMTLPKERKTPLRRQKLADIMPSMEMDAMPQNLPEWIKKQDDSFAVMLLKLIDKKGMTDVQCYKKANVSKKTFWKINNDPDYRPSKATVLCFAVALELTIEETNELLRTVGFTLSHSNTFDMIIEFYMAKGIYDVFTINEALYKYDQPCLGC